MTQFSSGAKSSGTLPPYETLTKLFLQRAAARLRLGMHYGKHNWKKGIKDKDFILDRLNHAFEHLVNAMHEIDTDQSYKNDDLSAVVVNSMFAMHYQEEVLKYRDEYNEVPYMAVSNLVPNIPIKDNELAQKAIIDAVPLLSPEDIPPLIDYLKRFKSDLYHDTKQFAEQNAQLTIIEAANQLRYEELRDMKEYLIELFEKKGKEPKEDSQRAETSYKKLDQRL